MSRKPLIGVVPLWDDDKESLWILPGYFDGIQQAGGLPLMLPLTDDQHETAQLASLPFSRFSAHSQHQVDIPYPHSRRLC